MPPAIETKGLSFAYPDRTVALSDVSLSIAEGERMSIVGPNGAGKSTLLLLLAGLRKPTKGSVVIDGRELSEKQRPQLKGKIGVVFQDPDDQVFMPTVREDVAFGPTNLGLSEREIDDRVDDAMKATGLVGFDGRSPHHLSVGERKRVAIAGILAMAPSMILLDEPTSGLDPRGKEEVMRLIGGMPGTVVLVTHDMDLALEFSSRVILLNRTVTFDGDAADLFRDRHLLESAGLRQPRLFRTVEMLKEKGILDAGANPRSYSELERLLD